MKIFLYFMELCRNVVKGSSYISSSCVERLLNVVFYISRDFDESVIMPVR
ncbi:hypothetical protein HMPREF1870_01104 [Bacteroidales bacterium KA00344]|nr:hypothetical protein HMPREF1870_01104 [Bacteroidales bacterium KA00344]